MYTTAKHWDWQVSSDSNKWDWNIYSLLSYRHLIISLIRRNLLLNFQQTVLGPVWLLVQPILTLIVYVFVFGNIIGFHAKSTLPPVLFYFAGIVLWNFFNDSFTGTSRVFRDNIYLFSKVYFPRIIIPISLIATNLVRFLVQLAFLTILLLYYVFFKGFTYELNASVLLFPVAIAMVALTSLSLGLIFSVLTAKYRDIANFLDVCIRLLFFVTPVLYPLSFIREDIRWVVMLNPLTPFFELFRLGFLGEGLVSYHQLLYAFLFVIICFTASLFLFQKQGGKLIDVV
jgi:lipopolysaccharide transport system permease protein